MSLLVPINGVNYIIPETNEVGWGSNLDDFFVAISAGTLQKTGGNFTLSAETDFGASYGLKSVYYSMRGTPATSGQIRMGNLDLISWRNAGNSANLSLTVNGSNQLTFDGTPIQTNSLTSAHILVGNASNVATSVAMTGDISIDNTGLTAIGSGKIVNAQVNASAAIAYSKLNLTGSIVNADVNASAAIAYSKLNLALSVVNADVSTSAAIAYSKLNLTGAILNADVNASAAIAYSKLALTGSILNADINASAAIAYTKLNLSSSIVNADVASAAAIVRSKLAATETVDVTYASGKGMFWTDSGSATVKLTAPTTVSASYTLKLPTAQGGSNQYLTNDGSGNLSWTNAAGTGTVNSGTANQLAYYASTTNAVSGLTAITASRALASDSNGLPVAQTDGTTAVELGYVHGVTSAIQTQINTKATDSLVVHLAGTESITGAKTFTTGITIQAALSGSILDNLIYNSSNTSSSQTRLEMAVGGGSAGDSWILQDVVGGGSWSFGVDNSDSDAWCLTNASSLNGTNIIRTTSSSVSIPNTYLQAGGNQVLPILQVVQTVVTTNFAATSGTYTSTNLTASITPKFNTSKILILIMGSCKMATNSTSSFDIFRGSTALSTSGVMQEFLNGDAATRAVPISMFYYDSPATTSATTYTLKVKVTGGTTNFADGVDQNITLIELAQ